MRKIYVVFVVVLITAGCGSNAVQAPLERPAGPVMFRVELDGTDRDFGPYPESEYPEGLTWFFSAPSGLVSYEFKFIGRFSGGDLWRYKVHEPPELGVSTGFGVVNEPYNSFGWSGKTGEFQISYSKRLPKT